jgi:hypothetical protein
VAVTQRITGGDDPAWPDEREPAARRQRWWPWAVLLALLVIGGGLGYLAGNRRHPLVVSGLECYSGAEDISSIDYSWSTGPDSASGALQSFLATSLAKSYPRSGYSTISSVALPSGIMLSTPKGTTYVHRAHGQVDAVVTVEHLGSVWQVTETRSCA